MAKRKPIKRKRAKPAKKTPAAGLDREISAIRSRLKTALGAQLKAEDLPAFEILCRAIAQLEHSQREVEREPIITLPNEVRAVNPHAKLIDLNRKIVADGLTRFGLTPLDRTRVEKAEGDAPSPPAPSPVPRSESEEDDFERHLRSRPATIPLRNATAG